MKHTTAKMITVLVVLLGLLSCEKDSVTTPPSSVTHYGPEKPLGGGVAKAFITLNYAGNPVNVGFAISETAMNNLPHDEDHYGLALDLPSQANGKTPFKFLGLDYNPHGHEPVGVYNVPHFDFHFYKITNAERLAITAGDPKLDVLPAESYLPATYFPAGGVPQMGNHWIDPASPELNGEPFTKTLIYGSYDGKVTFVEPMITVEHIKAKDWLNIAIKQPQKFAPAGYYPTTYSVHHNLQAKLYEITIENFVNRTAN